MTPERPERRLRVLLTSPIFPPDLGGPAVYVPSLGRFLVERGHEVEVVAFCSDPEPKGWPFRVVSIARGPLPLRYLKAFWQVWKSAKHADVVYVNEHLALLHVLAAKLRRKPVMIRIMVDGAWEISHRKGWCGDDDIVTFQGKPYGWQVKLTRALQRRWWKWSDHIIACSEFLRQIVIGYGVPAGKVQRIHNAYHGPRAEDVRETRDEARAKLGLAAGKRYVLTICRLMVWKRVDGILEALVGLPDDVHLLVAGDGDMQAEWTALGENLGLGERVHWLGNVPHKDIPLHVRAADVFVLNSRYEGLSHTLLEVQALGTPIVASNVCGNPEVVAHGVNGLLVDPQDPADLREALRWLLAEPALGRSFVEAGFARRDEFRRDLTFADVEAQLARLAARRGALGSA